MFHKVFANAASWIKYTTNKQFKHLIDTPKAVKCIFAFLRFFMWKTEAVSMF